MPEGSARHLSDSPLFVAKHPVKRSVWSFHLVFIFFCMTIHDRVPPFYIINRKGYRWLLCFLVRVKHHTPADIAITATHNSVIQRTMLVLSPVFGVVVVVVVVVAALVAVVVDDVGVVGVS
jgi:hypothetical protein